MIVANTTYMGMNALHDAGGLGMLPVYLYLPWEVKMDVGMPDTVQGNSFIHAFQFLGLVFCCVWISYCSPTTVKPHS